MIVEQITLNQDAGSLYIHKSKNTKLTFGPVWDFDWGFCYDVSQNILFAWENTFILFEPAMEYYAWELPPIHKFFARLFKFSKFIEQYKAIWNENYSKFDFDFYIDSSAKIIREHAKKDSYLWQQHTWRTYKNYNEAIVMLKDFLKTRINYINTQINSW